MPKGQKPGTRGADIRGLDVRYIELLEMMDHNGYRNCLRSEQKTVFMPGWYICVQLLLRTEGPEWEAVISLRFARKIDCERAKSALVAAGLDSSKRMKAAGAETVIRTAYEALQW
jgi:hypothetical protein